MDIHPLVVHFPIALLMTYSLFEIVSIKKLQEKQYWFFVKAIMLFLGEIGALAAILSAKVVSHPEGIRILEYHERFAYATAVIFGVLTIIYALAWFNKGRLSMHAAKLVFDRWIILPIAVAGLIAIVITGGLGGAMVYGTDFDPFMAPVFKLLNLK